MSWFIKRKLKNITLDNYHSNLWKDSLVKFKANKVAFYSLIVLVGLVVISMILPYFLSWKYAQIDWNISFPSAPSTLKNHYLGTDSNGRDMLVRCLLGLKISFLVGLLASLVSLIIGVIYGSISGFMGGKTDQIMMRIVDILYSLPFMFLVILLMVVFGRHFFLIFIALGLVGWLVMARIVRGEALAIKNKEYIEAAKSYGVSNLRIIFKHILPNLMGTIIIYLTLTIPEIILTESFLSFLGLGVQEPMTSLGLLISQGAKLMNDSPWLFWPPTILLAIILFCFNFIGDGLRDALDPKQK
ncbi:ABC transporter permease [Rickettsiales bacterium LUAb2]